MRKFILLLTIAISFMACNKDDLETLKQDALLGEWKLIEIRQNGNVDKIEIQNAVLLHFQKDGSFDVKHYGSMEANGCISLGKIDEGTWKNIGNDAYNIDGDAITPKFEGNTLIMISTNGDESTSNGVFERQ